MRLALYQPYQAGNVGTILRLAACLGVPVDIIEPCGFPLGDRTLKRAAMDYAELASIDRHASWEDYQGRVEGRLVLLTTRGGPRIDEAQLLVTDSLLMGAESTGVPDDVHARADLRVRIPQLAGTRSLNIAVAAGIALGEALRQTNGWPE